MTFFAKIAGELKEAVGSRATHGYVSEATISRFLAGGAGWSVEDLICTCGPNDRTFEERHSRFSVALVLAGSFQYQTPGKSRTGYLMTPGSVLLGNPGQAFECLHDHGQGDRCLSFHFDPDFFEAIGADEGLPQGRRRFSVLRLPAARETSPIVARACAGLIATEDTEQAETRRLAWEEIAISILGTAAQLAAGEESKRTDPLSSSVARVTRAIRAIEEDEQRELTLENLSREARLSPYHFLRTFEQVTGVTPHQYVRRMRLRKVAARLLTESTNVLDVVFDCGFGDLASFNRAFRNEFGVSPRQFRRGALPALLRPTL